MAVALAFCGLSVRQIATEVGRSPQRINQWKKTDAWIEAREEIFNDRFKMRVRDTSTTINEMARQIIASHWRL